MEILIAGAGHGGLCAAGILAKNGMDVTVLERNPEADLGYDWTDIFNLACFSEAGIPLPEPREYRQSEDMTFVSPSWGATLTAAAIREPGAEVVMERRAILRHLIAFARGGGAKLVFETVVLGPLVDGNRVTGLLVKDGDGERRILADLVIDAAGMRSPVRTQLPERLGIQREFGREQYFTVFRAFYEHTGRPARSRNFSVYFFPMGRRCINWIAEEAGEYVDQLCGTFGDTDRAFAEEVRKFVLPRHPELGEKIVRGGRAVTIPVRRPLGRMVADGYAALGDSAAMTVPLVGSGICNAVRAGRMLARRVLSPDCRDCSAAELWPWQVEYMRQIGAVHASLDVLKGFMLSLRPKQLDFIFAHKVLESPEMTKARTGREITLSLGQMALRGLRGAGNPVLLLRTAGALFASKKMKRHALRIPERYDEKAIERWVRGYEGIG